MLDGLADRQDLSAWYPNAGVSHFSSSDRDAIEMLERMFHKSTIFGLEQDRSVYWPGTGRLQITGVLCTPLFCTLAKNSDEVKVNREALGRGETETVVVPDCEVSPHGVVWSLRPAMDENDWQGYSPRFMRMIEGLGPVKW